MNLPTHSPPITIRDAIPSEAKYLSDLTARSKSHWPYDQEYLKQAALATQVTEEDIRFWYFRVAESEGNILGFYGLAPVNNEYQLDHLWIEPKYIGQGIGKILFADAVLYAKKSGWTKFTIVADPYAENFYLKQGAQRIGKRESKIKPGFFLPVLEFNIGLTLIGNKNVINMSVQECGEPIVDFAKTFSELQFDWSRHNVQKKSLSISLGRQTVGEKLIQAQNLLPKWWHWSYGDKYWALQSMKPFAIYDSVSTELNI